MTSNNIIAVPTNIITGFLGVGKTSAILYLLKNKPANERWAILVNEFGEVGIDGSLISGQYTKEQGVYIREVPGGCMCCAAGVPMQIALNQLLLHAKPDRLLIEPTGLGHPKEILKVLSAEHYQNALLLQRTLTLVGARNLTDTRYTSHDIFNQQIAIADTVIGNKADLYQKNNKERLVEYVKTHAKSGTDVHFVQHGRISLSHLIGATALNPTGKSHHHATKKNLVSDLSIPECGFIKAINTGEGFSSIGWRFSSVNVFNYDKLQAFLNADCATNAERIKATFITERGTFGYNVTADGLTEVKLSNTKESRIEVISRQIDNKFETLLMACIESD